MMNLNDLKIKLFADGAELETIRKMAALPYIKGFTTNPTLMRKAGTTDYKAFALRCLKIIGDKPISFEVFADDMDGMIKQGQEIASWGANVYVKIPVSNTKGQPTAPVIQHLANQNVKLNITAIFTPAQVEEICQNLNRQVPAIISIFAGRIADTGRDPIKIMKEAKAILSAHPLAELLWASPRELLNVIQADAMHCDIITATSDILNKLNLLGKDLNQYSLETVEMFYRDAQAAGFTI